MSTFSFAKKNKLEKLLIFVALVFLASGSAPFKMTAQAATSAQGIAAAELQMASYINDAAVQQKKAIDAATSGDSNTATIASDQYQVDAAGVTLQQAYIKDDTLRQQGASAANIATADAVVNEADAVFQQKQAVLAAANGNASGAAQAAANAKTDATAANGNAVAAGGTGVPTGSNFVPLTNLPIFGSNITSAPTLPAFLNSLYLYCVGIAAVLAVVQIMHAGILYMGGDSVTETKQAKSLIASSILGLVLVLSPVIVFGIINPKILNLNIGFSALAPTNPTGTANPAAAATPNTANGTVAPGGACTTDNNCQDLSATQTYGCYLAGGNGTCTLNGDAPPPANPANGTVPPGGACTTDNNCQDTSPTQTYGCYPEGNGTCTPNGNPVLPIPAPTTPTP